MDLNGSPRRTAAIVALFDKLARYIPEMVCSGRLFQIMAVGLCFVVCLSVGAVTTDNSKVSSIREKINAKEFTEALEDALNEIAKVERADRYASELADLYELVGDAALDMGDTARSIMAYDQALFHKRITYGLVDPVQLELVRKQTRVFVKNSDLREATDRFEYAYQVATRAYGSRDLRVKSTLLALASWYNEIRYPQIARQLYERLADIEDIKSGDVSEFNLQHQLRVAETYYLQAFPLSLRVRGRPLWQPKPYGYNLPESTLLRETRTSRLGPGNIALKKAVQIARDIHGEHSAEHLDVLLKLADWRLAFKLWRQAFGTYKEIWDVLATTDPSRLNQVFGQPVFLFDVRPGTPRRMFESIRENRTQTGVAEYSYSISRKGEVEDLITLRKTPQEFDTYSHRRDLGRMRFRPAFVDGEPVKSWDRRRVIRFLY